MVFRRASASELEEPSGAQSLKPEEEVTLRAVTKEDIAVMACFVT
jgi:hypothetical protein